MQRLKAEKVKALEGAELVQRMGAKAKLRSVYIRDPDGNLVELSNMISSNFLEVK